MSEVKELLATLPAVSGSDFTIWKTESENYPYVLVVYSYYDEVDGRYTYQVRSGTTLGSFITGCAQSSGSSSNSNYVMYDQRVYYYDNTTATWVLSSNHTKKGTVTKITIGDEVLQGSADTVIFSTRDIWTGNRDIGYQKDYRFLLSSRKRIESPFDAVFTEEHLGQLGYEAGDHILRLATNTHEALYVLKGVEEASMEVGYTSSSSSYLSLTFPACEAIAGLRYATSSGAYTDITTVITQSSTSVMVDDYVVYSTLDLTFNGRLMRLRDHYVTGTRDEILSIQPDEIMTEETPIFTGETSPSGLEITPVIPYEEAINPDKPTEDVVLTFRAGNAYPYDKSFKIVAKKILPKSLTVNPASIEDFIGATHQLSVEVLPEDADDKSVSFITDNDKVATVDETGLITLKGEGETFITITSNANPDVEELVPVVSIRPYEKPVINRLTVNPANPFEGDRVSFVYDVSYDRATFKAEEWENKKESYPAGRHTVRVRVQDTNDLWSEWFSLSFNVERAYEAPVISQLTATPTNPLAGDKITFNYQKTIDDRLTLKEEIWTNKRETYEAGQHEIKLKIKDSLDQESNELSLTLNVAEAYRQPVISNLKMTPENPEIGEAVSFTYDHVIDDRLTIQSENWINKQASYDEGRHTVSLSITDSEGQESNVLSLTFDVVYKPQLPLITDLTMNPAEPYDDEAITFNYQAEIDPRGTIIEEIWENKQGQYPAGNHVVKLAVKDSFNQVSEVKTLAFNVKRRPMKPMVDHLKIIPENPTTEDEVLFTYDLTLDPEATLIEERWENKATTYEAGTHTVKLSVIDSLGQESNEIALTFEVSTLEEDPDFPRPDEYPHIYEITVDPPNPRAGELLSYSYVVALERGTEAESINWINKKTIFEEEGVKTMTLEITDSAGRTASKTIEFEVLEASDIPHPPKPKRVKHLEITRWSDNSRRFLILEGRELS